MCLYPDEPDKHLPCGDLIVIDKIVETETQRVVFSGEELD